MSAPLRTKKAGRAATRSPWRRRAAGMLRVTLFATVCAAASGAWVTSRAKAEAAREGFRLGKDLVPLQDLLDGRYDLSLNGQDVSLSNTTTEQPVGTVLDRFEEQCKKNPGALSSFWSEVGKGNQLKGDDQSLVTNLSIVRTEEEGAGVVMCFVKNGEKKALDALAEFAETQDLSALGKLRYVFARPDKAGSTHVMTLWTEGSFRIEQVLSEAEGRVPEDVRYVPRPPDSRFVFDARIRSTPYGVRVYRSTQGTGNVAAHYDAHMGEKGWDIAKPPVPGGETRAYLKEGVSVVVSSTRDDETGETLVALVEMGANAPFVE